MPSPEGRPHLRPPGMVLHRLDIAVGIGNDHAVTAYDSDPGEDLALHLSHEVDYAIRRGGYRLGECESLLSESFLDSVEEGITGDPLDQEAQRTDNHHNG